MRMPTPDARRRWIVVAAALLIAPPAWGQETPAKGMTSTLLSGDFDDYLMVAANRTANTLSGYYNDGKCRLPFTDR